VVAPLPGATDWRPDPACLMAWNIQPLIAQSAPRSSTDPDGSATTLLPRRYGAYGAPTLR